MDRSMERVGLASLIVVWFIFFKFPLGAVYADQLAVEVDALLKFKVNLDDPNHVLESWQSGANLCTWTFVQCNDDDTSVIRVDVGNANLSGPLDPALGNLKNLQTLNLYQNRLNGSIPSEFKNFTSLTNLALYQNRLDGSIPDGLKNLANLKSLELQKNNLNGTVSQDLADFLKKVNYVDLTRNHFGPGDVPCSNVSCCIKNPCGPA